MPDRALYANMQEVLETAPTCPLTDSDRMVIVSDLHLGDGSRKDDFLPNAQLFRTILRDFYLPGGFRLVLNGDVEELHKFSLRSISRRWASLYDLFRAFEQTGRLHKLRGNHDFSLDTGKDDYSLEDDCPEAVRFDYHGHTLLVFHGHQASMVQTYLGPWSERFVRHIVAPLGIRNPSASHDSRVRIRMEQRVYGFARERGIAAVIGHTHRPLFESLSKVDSLRFQIEHLCRLYATSANGIREELAAKVRAYSRELQEAVRQDRWKASRGSLYNSHPLVPCLFNSGCVIGKRGMTAIEIDKGKISLIHWFDRNRSSRFFHRNGYQPDRLDGTEYYRVVLNEDLCSYLFARIHLLT